MTGQRRRADPAPDQPNGALKHAGEAERHDQLHHLRCAGDRTEHEFPYRDAEQRSEHDCDRQRKADRHPLHPFEQREVDVGGGRRDRCVREVEHSGRAVHEHDPHREKREDRADAEAEHRVLQPDHELASP